MTPAAIELATRPISRRQRHRLQYWHLYARWLKIYLDSGWPRDNYEPTRAMRDRLIWKGYCPSSELFYLAFPRAQA